MMKAGTAIEVNPAKRASQNCSIASFHASSLEKKEYAATEDPTTVSGDKSPI